MKFSAISIFTHDLDKSIAFYQNVIGLTLDSMSSPFPGQRTAVLCDEKGHNIEILQNDVSKPFSGEGISLVFTVNQIGEAAALMKKNNVPVVSAPKTLKNGMKSMIVSDPNGVELNLIEE